MGEPDVPATWIKPVVTVAAVGSEGQASGTRFVIELHLHGDLVTLRGQRAEKAQSPSTETRSLAVDRDGAGPLAPVGSGLQRLPFAGAEAPYGDPAIDGDGVGFVQQKLAAIETLELKNQLLKCMILLQLNNLQY